MRILFLISRLCGGGAERVLVNLASELSKNNEVYIHVHRLNSCYEVSDRVKIINLGLVETNNPILKVKNYISAIHDIKRTKKMLRPDFTVSMLRTSNFENIVTKGIGRSVISVRFLYSKGNYNWLTNYMIWYANTFSDNIVALSDGVKKDLVQNYHVNEKKIDTIFNPCNINRIKALINEECDENFMRIRAKADILFVTAGRLVKQKGQWHIIRAFAELVRTRRNCKLVILGEGELYNDYNKMINDLGCEDHIFLLGFKNNVYPYLYKSDIFIFPSLYEGFGNILLEAMACSLPIISSDYEVGSRELLAPGTANVIEPGGIELAEYGILTSDIEKKYDIYSSDITDGEKALIEAANLLIDDSDMRKNYKKKSEERIKDYTIESIVSDWNKKIFSLKNER